ncbi:hypothetical protein [uncultured Cyclobacterium sp.]|uniref:hypothetical protein n=1 Tax=uncultured Cyclobacterium sp. TaxID=453820 RepID=UPI0030EB5C18
MINSETGEWIPFPLVYDTLYTQTKNKINFNALFTELIDINTLRVSTPNQIPFCQTDDIEDVKNILTEDKKFIHLMDLADEFTDFMVNDIGAIFTPSMVSSLKGVFKPFIYSLSIEELRNDSFDEPIEFMSPRGYRNIKEASKIRKSKTSNFDETEVKILKMAEIELKFEEVRREICNWAPSRLSSIYLMDDTESSAGNLEYMFRNSTRRYPKVILFRHAGLARVIKVDYRWFEKYAEDKNIEYIKKYWQSKPFIPGSTTWEYLYEGGLFPLDEEFAPYK